MSTRPTPGLCEEQAPRIDYELEAAVSSSPQHLPRRSIDDVVDQEDDDYQCVVNQIAGWQWTRTVLNDHDGQSKSGWMHWERDKKDGVVHSTFMPDFHWKAVVIEDSMRDRVRAESKSTKMGAAFQAGPAFFEQSAHESEL